MRPSHLLVPLLAGWILACAAGPRRVEQTEYERTITQTTVVPAARGPAAVGPMAPEGAVTLEANAAGAYFQAPIRTPEFGGPGQWTAGDWVGGRVSAGVTRWLELGISADASPLLLANRSAKHLERMDEDWIGRGGVQLRFARHLGERSHLVFDLEGDVARVPYDYGYHLTATTTRFEEQGDPTVTVDTVDRETSQWNVLWTGRAGVGYYGDIGPVSLGGGVSLQTLPVFFGRSDAHWTCTYWEDGSSECSPAPEPPASELSFVPTAYAMAAWRVNEHVVLLAQPWADLPTGDAVLSAPAGVIVGMRFVAPPRAEAF